MNTTRIIIINLFASIVIALVICWSYIHFGGEKIGYVKSGVVIKEYKGMVAASEQYNKELQVVQANLDTLHSRYEKLQVQENEIRGKEREEWSYRLGIAKTEFEKYNDQATRQMEARRDELTRKVLETINNFIVDYGKKNNYKLILGTTEDGSILYGKEGDDLTQTILSLLNETYGKNGAIKNTKAEGTK